MRRKLIKQDAFEQIANSSITTAEHELVEAQGILARALGKDHLSLQCFNESTVLYETLDDTYVHAGYELKNGHLTFNNIEELVIDQESKKNKMQSVLSDMLEAVLVDNNEKASGLFKDYLNMYSWTEAKKTVVKNVGEKGDHSFEAVETEDKPKSKGKFPHKLDPASKRKGEATRKKNDRFKIGGKGKNHDNFKAQFTKKLKSAGKKIEEAYQMAENVLGYVQHVRFGPVLAESAQQADDHGNVVHLKIPASKLRNENKIQSTDWRILNQKVKTLRENALALPKNQDFCKGMAVLKRQNALNNSQELQEVLETVVRSWPFVIYTTQAEMARMIGEALNVAGIQNYDDQTCEFMAEGVLRTAHAAYTDRVGQILHLASAPKCEANADAYEHFQKVVEQFYPSVDEKFNLERKVFSDLYETLESLYKTADRRGDEGVKRATAGYLNELAHVLNDESKPDVELAEEVANWLMNFIETNLEGGVWNVSNTPHITVVGDHPDMEKKARHKYAPSQDFSGDWGDAAPMIGQDDMNYKGGKHSKEARSNSWGNIDGADVYPNLKNPVVPKPFGDYTMKGEKGVDKDSDGVVMFKSGDVFPALQNPYVPKAETAKTYKMKADDLVVDK